MTRRPSEISSMAEYIQQDLRKNLFLVQAASLYAIRMHDPNYMRNEFGKIYTFHHLKTVPISFTLLFVLNDTHAAMRMSIWLSEINRQYIALILQTEQSHNDVQVLILLCNQGKHPDSPIYPLRTIRMVVERIIWAKRQFAQRSLVVVLGALTAAESPRIKSVWNNTCEIDHCDLWAVDSSSEGDNCKDT